MPGVVLAKVQPVDRGKRLHLCSGLVRPYLVTMSAFGHHSARHLQNEGNHEDYVCLQVSAWVHNARRLVAPDWQHRHLLSFPLSPCGNSQHRAPVEKLGWAVACVTDICLGLPVPLHGTDTLVGPAEQGDILGVFFCFDKRPRRVSRALSCIFQT